ncbi:competence damage-inducible protein A [Thermobispora bispora]|jgi:nicotinamide-nucleotide amidase|uniref:CinA domain protein n=1 Tax=Thermobispora bispora (strain ATCC 19993 / DSM 43833 / CBS 139.67 / JCM 10125 / KCTC 9307 / NBRC 14880 / R51) TaxID=469371 RepID=D6Y800_THEBD|nr:nicotinamide-nucleotide amidohydrolase family protein [Thermobispora bispora]MBO2473704.1 competence protein [Actinomycetales bacterium]MDI9582089.1 nicotinamide-nucleotide amidohydrolase family protein [Thermobispora sp.]ADG87819.1 CinA domain protein [Thermobispora bispora DSM 43833]MBX6166737.1 nicotinamide-nucleotide amidohydrolase family protein [Thermobispora bispora]QSI47716.1 nicotinamide-nucleotide amidohydrolase family protein [Thermobispora bispora]
MRHLAAQVLSILVRLKATVSVAESLTGGLLGATLTDVPGASAAFRGGVIAYATEVKASVLGVPAELLAREGAVHPEVAAAMAAGVRELTRSDYGIGLTGVAGPEPQDGKPVGTVHIALCGPGGRTWHRDLRLTGGREEIRRESCAEALGLLAGVLRAKLGEQSG